MSSVEQLKAQAIDLGFTGVEVAQYVLQQQQLEREERAREREERAREQEREERMLKEERDFELAKLRLEKESQLKVAQL